VFELLEIKKIIIENGVRIIYSINRRNTVLILQAVRLAARWPACCLLAHGRHMGPTGMNGLAAGGGPAYWAQLGDLSEEKQIRS